MMLARDSFSETYIPHREFFNGNKSESIRREIQEKKN